VVRHPLHFVEQVRREDHRAAVIGHGAHHGVEDVATHDHVVGHAAIFERVERELLVARVVFDQ
jgi:hypothetical protein